MTPRDQSVVTKAMWTCDYKGCDEIAQWCRKYKRQLFTLCTTHEAYFQNKHWGRHIDHSELDQDDIRYLKKKEHLKEEAKAEPFEVLLSRSRNGTCKIRIRDRRTDETRLLIIKNDELQGFHEAYKELGKRKFAAKRSVDAYVEGLRKRISAEQERDKSKQ